MENAKDLFIFLRVFVTLRKRNISFVASVCPSVGLSVCLPACPHETTQLPLKGFLWNCILNYFFNIISIIRRHTNNMKFLLICILLRGIITFFHIL